MSLSKFSETAVLISFLFATIIFVQPLAAQERTKSFQVNSGGTLTLSTNPGNITLTTWNKKEISVEIKGLDDDDLDEVEITQNGNEINISYDGSSGWSDDADFYINLPSVFNVNLKTTGGDIKIKNALEGMVKCSTAGGNINTSDIKGAVKLNTSGGDIETGDISGELNLNTQGGNITVGKVNNGAATVNTMGGNINISDVSSNLKAKTYGGNIKIGNVGGDANVTTFGGNINLDKVTGSAEMNTYGGNISLKSASGKVDAKTQGGNLTLKNITGSIDAFTAGGNILVELIPSGTEKSSIKTSAGEIELLFPGTQKRQLKRKLNTMDGVTSRIITKSIPILKRNHITLTKIKTKLTLYIF